MSRQSTPTDESPFDAPEDRQRIDCPHCGRPFATGRQRDLHRGEVHADAIDDDERAAYEAALDAERDDLWLYHFKAVVVLLVVYMLTGLAYLVVLSG